MTHAPYTENASSQIPALQLLINLGFEYLTPEEALELRGGCRDRVILADKLRDWISANNSIAWKGQTHHFSTENINNAMRAITDFTLDEGLVRTSEAVYDLLTLGKSLPQTVDQDRRSFTLGYIDWDNWANNDFYVTDEFAVERVSKSGEETRRPDLVCFVNGIPLLVIECKRSDLVVPGQGQPVDQAISQVIRNQKPEEIPRLFIYSQIVMALAVNRAKFGTTGTEAKFWSIWKEPDDIDREIEALINQPLQPDVMDRIFASEERRYLRPLFEHRPPRKATEQDRMIFALGRRNRLLELAYQYILYDKGVKKIARFQQYHAVQETLKRVREWDSKGHRRGGVIWHTTGTGKSIAMVMLAKALTLEKSVKNPRVVLVTDRIDLDNQIWNTFRNCGKSAEKAKTGKHLIELIESGSASIITTVNAKFLSARKQRKVKSESTELFVLVDEGHRGQSGFTAASMRNVFPNACYIGYSGTPLLKGERKTVHEFGGIIHRYTIDEAQIDGMVVPLLYEGRTAVQEQNRSAIDSWFELVTRNLSRDQKRDLKRKFARSEHINETEQRIKRIALDISLHYVENWKDTPFKAQLATSSKATAIRYKDYLDEFGEVTSEVVISPPDAVEGHTDVDRESKDMVIRFWKRMMDRFGSATRYRDDLISAFKNDDDIDILIVVDMLLTGFDAPVNTVLYVDKQLKEHNVIQAISRVNRLRDGKDYGYIVDYRGILAELDEAMDLYSALKEFYDEDDIGGTVINVDEEIAKLPSHHGALVDVFKTLDNAQDNEACERFLADEAIRDQFYEILSQYGRTLKIALSSSRWIDTTSEKKIAMYKRDLRHYVNMRRSVSYRYAERVDFGAYEEQIRKLLDTHITSADIEQVTEQFNIHEQDTRQDEVAKVHGEGAVADHIAHELKATCNENMEKDPTYYKRFSALVQQAIEDYRARRMSEREYLEQVRHLQEQVTQYTEEDLPEILHYADDAKAYYHVVREPFAKYSTDGSTSDEVAAEVGLKIQEIIDANTVRDWINNQDVQNQMKNDMDDYLFDLKADRNLPITGKDIDTMMDELLEVARRRSRE